MVLGRALGELGLDQKGTFVREPVVISGSFILKAELGKGDAAHEH